MKEMDSLMAEEGGELVLSRNPHDGVYLNFYRIQAHILKVRFGRQAFHTSPIPPWYNPDCLVTHARYLTADQWNEEQLLTRDDPAWWRFDPPPSPPWSSDTTPMATDLNRRPSLPPVGWTAQGHYVVKNTTTGECFLADESLKIIPDYQVSSE